MGQSSSHPDLQRFVDAQFPIYSQARAEIAAGKKQSHWMWFIFPQLQALGSSPTARLYAIHNLQEAEAYLAHPVLGARLRGCTALVHGVSGRSANAIFGSPDDRKFHSCMTLFMRAAGEVDKQEDIFCLSLEKYFGGEPDAATLQLLNQ